MKIAFHSNQLGLRGTEVALFDYAQACEELLGHRALILHQRDAVHNDPGVIAKFAARFPVESYSDFSEVEGILSRRGADLLYLIKGGMRDGRLSHQLPNAVHAVFPAPESEAHGQRYAFVSRWLADYCTAGRLPFVPHMIHVPAPERSDPRAELAIPKDTFVFGCHGGAASFSVPFAAGCVEEAIERRSDVHFLFMNIPAFCKHERVRFLPGTTDAGAKRAFLDCCDAMLHARIDGETFGLACGEFSILNKPVVTYALSPMRAHLDILGDAAICYASAGALTAVLTGLDRVYIQNRDWDRYSRELSPKPVMRKFAEVFLNEPSP